MREYSVGSSTVYDTQALKEQLIKYFAKSESVKAIAVKDLSQTKARHLIVWRIQTKINWMWTSSKYYAD